MRGLSGGSSLAELMKESVGHRSHLHSDKLTIKQIISDATVYAKVHGEWPKRKSGATGRGPDTWIRVDDALKQGYRGLSGGTSLHKLFSERPLPDK